MIEISKKRRPKSKNYFTQETEDAIVLYNKTKDHSERSKIYERSIHYPFFKLTQNIIHTFKFYHTDEENLEDIQHEIIIFLLSKIHLYDHKTSIQKRLIKIITKEFGEEYDGDFAEFVEQSDVVTQEQINEFISKLSVSEECLEKLTKLTPPKAFSYFGTIVKRWLIIYNQNNYKKKQKQFIVNENINEDKYIDEVENDTNYQLDQYIDNFVDFIEDNIYDIFPVKVSKNTKLIQEAEIADVILELFKKKKHLDILEKKAIYIHIKNKIDAKTPKITNVAEKLYTIFKHNYIFLLENDYVHFKLPSKQYL
jgi:hypothetical protein